jgi:hypothetical protein
MHRVSDIHVARSSGPLTCIIALVLTISAGVGCTGGHEENTQAGEVADTSRAGTGKAQRRALDCEGVVLKPCGSGSSSHYLLYPTVIALDVDARAFMDEKGILTQDLMGRLCSLGLGPDTYTQYDGDSLPAPEYFGIELHLNDSAAAAAAAEGIPEPKLFFDEMGYAGGGWVVRSERSFGTEEVDSVLGSIEALDIEVNQSLKVDRNQLFFYARCLDERTALATKKVLDSAGVPVVAARLTYLEQDL